MSRTVTICLFVALALAACGAPAKDTKPEMLQMDGTDYRVSGPYKHDNLAIYLIHQKDAKNDEYITLDEGLKNGTIVVTEKKNEQVSQLMIQNGSGKPLFIQEGDRLRGGKQDRIVGISMVVPSKKGTWFSLPRSSATRFLPYFRLPLSVGS